MHGKRDLLLLYILCGVFFLGTWTQGRHIQSAQAQSDSTAFQVQQFRPWNDPYGMFQTSSGETLGSLKYNVGAMFNYAHVPLRLLKRNTDGSVATASEVLRHHIAADINLALGILSFMDIAIQLPVTLYQVGAFPNDPAFGSNSGRDISGFYIGDMKVALKFQLLTEKKKKNPLGLGLQLWLGLPTAQIGAQKNFNGEEGLSFGAGVLLNKTLSIATLAANFGYRFNPRTEFVSLVISHELYYSLGLRLAIMPKTLDLVFDLSGAINFAEQAQLRSAPIDVYAGVRIYPLKKYDLALNAGIGLPLSPGYGSPLFRVFFGLTYSPREPEIIDTDKDGLPDKKDKCPIIPGPHENKGCPWVDTDKDGLLDKDDRCPKAAGPRSNRGCPWGDIDGDGILDKDDTCPKRPGPRGNRGCPWPDTDRDGVLNKDDKCVQTPGPRANKGCPWPDTDKDGLLDKDDRCPKAAGPRSNQGCPLVIVNKKVRRIYILKKIFFEFNKASIKVESYPILDAVANILKRYKSINIRIEGHTDDKGSRRYNLNLSKKRARAVRSYLIRKGISIFRMKYIGRGETRPLAGGPRRFTDQQRAKNRRVEFHITHQ